MGTAVTHSKSARRIALFQWSFAGGGVERMNVRLASALLSRGYRVDIVVLNPDGPNRTLIPKEAKIIPLKRRTRLAGLLWAIGLNERLAIKLADFPKLPELFSWLPSYSTYLQEFKPDIVVSAMPHCNLVAAAAKAFCKETPYTMLTERNPPSSKFRAQPSHMRRFGKPMSILYHFADVLVGVSTEVSHDLATTLDIPSQHVETVYNPAYDHEIARLAAQKPNHVWFEEDESRKESILLSVGKLHPQKDFPTLIRAFAALHLNYPQHRDSRLLILGTGKQYKYLMKLARDLGVADSIDLPGYTDNPYSYMARSSVFILPSIYEGFGNVIVEALGCGCPVVATTAPGGPAEILNYGEFGWLVEPGDVAGMTEAIHHALGHPQPPCVLRDRAKQFSVEKSLDALMSLMP